MICSSHSHLSPCTLHLAELHPPTSTLAATSARAPPEAQVEASFPIDILSFAPELASTLLGEASRQGERVRTYASAGSSPCASVEQQLQRWLTQRATHLTESSCIIELAASSPPTRPYEKVINATAHHSLYFSCIRLARAPRAHAQALAASHTLHAGGIFPARADLLHGDPSSGVHSACPPTACSRQFHPLHSDALPPASSTSACLARSFFFCFLFFSFSLCFPPV